MFRVIRTNYHAKRIFIPHRCTSLPSISKEPCTSLHPIFGATHRLNFAPIFTSITVIANHKTASFIRLLYQSSKQFSLHTVCGAGTISPFSVSGAHGHWVGSTDSPSHSTKELELR